MPRPSFQRLEELFNRAVDLPAAEQAAFLDRECAGDSELRGALENMLENDRNDVTEDGRLASPLGEVSSKLRHEAPTLPAATMPAAVAPRPGVLPQVAGYELLEEIGRGGMGVVYKARQDGLNRLVALKMLLPFAVPTAEQLARFRTEAEALARLSHPNVVPIYEVGACPAGPFFSMEFVPGPSLATYLDGRPCEPGAAARFTEVLADAIAAVHHRGIVHRDLKPANVLLGPRGDASATGLTRPGARPALDEYEPKLTDFGLAKDQSAPKMLTLSGTTLGTPCYMAPEQAGGRVEKIGPPADLYSLGAILYEMLSGRPPFEGATPAETIALLIGDEPPSLTRLRHGLPRDLITICMKCLEKSPRRRYATAKDLGDDLRRFRRGEAIRARAIGPIGRTYRWCRRRPLVASLIALCTALAVAFVVTVTLYDIKLQEALQQVRKQANEEREEIVKLNVNIGIMDLENGDSYAAILRFTEALRREAEPSGHEGRDHRLRIGTALAESPQLVRLLVIGVDLLCARLTGDGGKVAAAGEGYSVEVWDVAKGQKVGPALKHGDKLTGGAFSADGRSLATVDVGGKVLVWNVEDGTSREISAEGAPEVRALAFHPDGRLAVVRGKPAELSVYDLTGKGPVAAVAPVATGGDQSVLAEDGRYLLTVTDAGVANVWDVAGGKTIGAALKSDGGVTRCALSPDGKRVAVVERGNAVRVGDAATGKWLAGPLRCHFAVRRVVLSPHGDKVFTAGNGHPALIWDATTGELLAELAPGDGEIDYARFSPEGTLLLTGDRIHRARVWNAVTGRSVTPPLHHCRPLLAAAFDADGRSFVTAGKTGVVCQWRLPDTLNLKNEFFQASDQPPAEPATGLLSLRLPAEQGEIKGETSSGGLVVRPEPGGVRVCDAATGRPVSRLMPHASPVRFAAFSNDSAFLYTVDADHNARVWDSYTGEPLGQKRKLTGRVVRIDGGSGKVICAGKEFSLRPSDNKDSLDRLSSLAQVLACGWIDEARQRQTFDPQQLRSAWETLAKTPAQK
jgi:WD40 repeat protein